MVIHFKTQIIMKAIVENPLMNTQIHSIKLFIEILNQITSCINEKELRCCIKLLEKNFPEIPNFFNYGFGHNHFWVSSLNGTRLIFVEF